MGENIRLKLLDDQLKWFYEMCIEEINRTNWKGSSLKIESWAVLGKKLEETYGKKATQRQLKNKFDYQKYIYFGWCYLRAKTGNIYNAQTNTFNLTEEEWIDFGKVHPKAISLRTTPLLYPELCATLYDKTSATGSIRQPVAPRKVSSTPTLQIEDVPVVNLGDDNINDTNETGYETGFESGFEGDSSFPNVDTVRPKKKSKKTIDLSDVEGDMRKIIANLVVTTKPKETTIDECHKKLKGLELDGGDPLYLAAFGIFGQPSSNYRESWMELPSDPKILKGWITMMAKMLGIM